MSEMIKSIDWLKTTQFFFLGLNFLVFSWIIFLITHTKEIPFSSLCLNYAFVSPIVITLFLLNKKILQN